MFVVSCLLFDGCGLLFVVWCLGVWCLVFVVCYSCLFVARWLLFVACCLFVACSMLRVGCWLTFGVRRVLCVGGCLLLVDMMTLSLVMC